MQHVFTSTKFIKSFVVNFGDRFGQALNQLKNITNKLILERQGMKWYISLN